MAMVHWRRPHIRKLKGGGFIFVRGAIMETKPMTDKAEKALHLVKSLAAIMTPEEAFENNKNDDGIVENDGVIYEDVDEMISDMDDDHLMDEYGAFMDFVRAAKEIMKEEET